MINKWHSWLGMVRHDRPWHEQDLADEIKEYHEETNLLIKWSELSDLVYACTRSHWDGYNLKFPLSKSQFYLGAVYMLPKYTSRWLFFHKAGKKAGAEKSIHEVRNPRRIFKLSQIAERHNLDEAVFQKICKRQLHYWPLLP